MHNILVMKFGGTSIKDASAMKRVLDIISTYKVSKNIIVLSACSGITDKLIEITKESISFLTNAEQILDNIYLHHFKLINDLIIKENNKKDAIIRIKNIFDKLRELILGIHILNECTEKTYNTIVSQGEFLSTLIFSIALKERIFDSILLDSRQYIIINNNDNESEIIFKNIAILQQHIDNYQFIIMQGFIASDIYGETALLGRGGSDYSASIIGNALNAQEIQIWTDVDGVLTTDPKILEKAKTISTMTFNEVRLLSFYGAKVLHPDTIKPAMIKSIPVWVKNTFSPEIFGTKIVDNSTNHISSISSIHLNQNCIFINIKKIETEDFIKLTNILNSINVSTFFSSRCDDNTIYIIKHNGNIEELETVLSSFDYNYVNIDLICICGTALSEPSIERNRIIAEIAQIAQEFNASSLIFGITSDSFLISTKLGKGIDCLKKLHKFLFE